MNLIENSSVFNQLPDAGRIADGGVTTGLGSQRSAVVPPPGWYNVDTTVRGSTPADSYILSRDEKLCSLIGLIGILFHCSFSGSSEIPAWTNFIILVTSVVLPASSAIIGKSTQLIPASVDLMISLHHTVLRTISSDTRVEREESYSDLAKMLETFRLPGIAGFMSVDVNDFAPILYHDGLVEEVHALFSLMIFAAKSQLADERVDQVFARRTNALLRKFFSTSQNVDEMTLRAEAECTSLVYKCYSMSAQSAEGLFWAWNKSEVVRKPVMLYLADSLDRTVSTELDILLTSFRMCAFAGFNFITIVRAWVMAFPSALDYGPIKAELQWFSAALAALGKIEPKSLAPYSKLVFGDRLSLFKRVDYSQSVALAIGALGTISETVRGFRHIENPQLTANYLEFDRNWRATRGIPQASPMVSAPARETVIPPVGRGVPQSPTQRRESRISSPLQAHPTAPSNALAQPIPSNPSTPRIRSPLAGPPISAQRSFEDAATESEDPSGGLPSTEYLQPAFDFFGQQHNLGDPAPEYPGDVRDELADIAPGPSDVAYARVAPPIQEHEYPLPSSVFSGNMSSD